MSQKLKRNDYYSEILKNCVKSGTKYFTSNWFYEKFPDVDHDILKNLVKGNFIKPESSWSRTYYVTRYFTEMRYLGLCLAAYIKNNPRNIKPEIIDCARRTYLSEDLIEFLTLTYDLTSAKKAGMLDMDIREVQLLEDYFYLRLASNAIKDDIELPVGTENQFTCLDKDI